MNPSSIVVLTVTHPIRGDAAKPLYKLDNMVHGKTYWYIAESHVKVKVHPAAYSRFMIDCIIKS